jgi:osmotically-inducible protein OsmY
VAKIRVDTDDRGMVWLSGTAPSREAADRAVQLARETEGVEGVKSSITVKRDD